MKVKKNAGFDLKSPKEKCNDKHCPFHSNLKVRGRTFTGVVIKGKMQKTVTVEFIRHVLIPKYERYIKKRSRIKAHVPECMKVNEGDNVKIMECKPISKTKNFVVVGKIEDESNKSKSN